MRKQLMILVALMVLPSAVSAKCVNGGSYVSKGYMETDAGIPVTGKTLSEIKFDFFYDDGTSSTGNNATAEMGQGWYRYAYTSNGKNGVFIMRDSTSTHKQFPGGYLETLCDSQLHTALVYSIWDEPKGNHTTADTFGDYLDSEISLVGGGLTVTAASGNTSTWRIPIDETSVITANDQYIGKKLMCNKEPRVIVDTIQGTPDLIIIEPGNPYSAAPDNVACTVE